MTTGHPQPSENRDSAGPIQHRKGGRDGRHPGLLAASFTQGQLVNGRRKFFY